MDNVHRSLRNLFNTSSWWGRRAVCIWRLSQLALHSVANLSFSSTRPLSIWSGKDLNSLQKSLISSLRIETTAPWSTVPNAASTRSPLTQVILLQASFHVKSIVHSHYFASEPLSSLWLSIPIYVQSTCHVSHPAAVAHFQLTDAWNNHIW